MRAFEAHQQVQSGRHPPAYSSDGDLSLLRHAFVFRDLPSALPGGAELLSMYLYGYAVSVVERFPRR